MRTGIKWTLAGTLSLFFALLLRLDHPTWAVATAFLCMTPRYVGAIAEKMALRILGAIAGASLGYLIVGSLQQSPVLFLLAIGGLTALGTMMMGGTFAPYGFYQCAYTAIIVSAQGLYNPAMSWQAGMARCEEIVLGIVVTMVVTSCLWPRYARVEFIQTTRATVRLLAGEFRIRTRAFLEDAPQAPSDVLGTVGGRLASLSKMVRVGLMESAAFRQRQHEVEQVVAELGILSTAIANFGRTLPRKSVFRDYVEDSLAELHRALGEAMDALAGGSEPDAPLARAGEALARYRREIEHFRRDDAGRNLDLAQSLEHSGHAISIVEIHHALGRIAGLIAEIESHQHEGIPSLRLGKFSPPSREWVLVGLRGAIAVVIGMVLTDWLRPPGGDMLVVGAFLFAGFVTQDTQPRGDLRVFRQLIGASLACVAFLLFLVAATPAMASYAVLNIILGAFLFLCGYLFEKGILHTFEIFFALLVTLILVGVNAQHPAPFESLAGPVLGLWLALILSTLVRRFCWPALPQTALRDRVAGLLTLLEKTARHPETTASDTTRCRLAFTAAEALTFLEASPTLPRAEAGDWHDYLRSLSRLGGHLLFSVGPQPTLENAEPNFPRHRAVLLGGIADRLAAQRDALLQRGARAICTPLDPDDWIAAARLDTKARTPGAFDSVLALGTLYRLREAALTANHTTLRLASLDPRRAFADSVL